MKKSVQKQNREYAEKGMATYKKGTRFTAKKIIKVSESECWAETLIGYMVKLGLINEVKDELGRSISVLD